MTRGFASCLASSPIPMSEMGSFATGSGRQQARPCLLCPGSDQTQQRGETKRDARTDIGFVLKGGTATLPGDINWPAAALSFWLRQSSGNGSIYFLLKILLGPRRGIFFIKILADHPHTLPLATPHTLPLSVRP
jgi:hypothetical protein